MGHCWRQRSWSLLYRPPLQRPLLLLSTFLALICCAAALSAVPGESVGGTLTLGGAAGPDLTLEVPMAVGDWILCPSENNELQILLTVIARTDWTLAVSSSSKEGRMAQFDPGTSEYPERGRSLSKPMTVSSHGSPEHPGSWNVVLPEAGAVHQGRSTPGQLVALSLQQPVAWEDEPLSEEQVYRIDLIFTLSPLG